MKIKTEINKIVTKNGYFQTLSVSPKTMEEMATIVGVLAIVAVVLSTPIVIFLLTSGLGY